MMMLTVVGLLIVFVGCIAMLGAQQKAAQVRTQAQYNTVIQELNNAKITMMIGFGVMAIGLFV